MSYTKEEIFFNDFEVIFSNREFLQTVKNDPKSNFNFLDISINELEEDYRVALECIVEHLKLTNNSDTLNDMFNGDFENVHKYFLRNIESICSLFSKKYSFNNLDKNSDDMFLILNLNTILCCLFELHTIFTLATNK